MKEIKSRGLGCPAYVAWETGEMHAEFMRVPQQFMRSAHFLEGGGFLRSVEYQFPTNFSGQHSCPIFKGE
jgi:hypothetical protein